MKDSIQIIVNGMAETVPADSLIDDLVKRFGEKDPHLIVEHNGRFVFAQEYRTRRVSSGDRLEFINPNFGG
ncbi:MAG: MoaD/ThiS family protein [Desulfobacterales bacterium]|nr:MoaD/ThiS family protein [Desulfobacterales bacterium]